MSRGRTFGTFSLTKERIVGCHRCDATLTGTMPKELPKVDLEHPSDLDYITDAVRRYALDVGKERLRARNHRDGPSPLEPTMERALERVRVLLTQWIYAARTRLMHNVLVNGLTFSDYSKQEAGVYN